MLAVMPQAIFCLALKMYAVQILMTCLLGQMMSHGVARSSQKAITPLLVVKAMTGLKVKAAQISLAVAVVLIQPLMKALMRASM